MLKLGAELKESQDQISSIKSFEEQRESEPEIVEANNFMPKYIGAEQRDDSASSGIEQQTPTQEQRTSLSPEELGPQPKLSSEFEPSKSP
jgi:hypothetical protein